MFALGLAALGATSAVGLPSETDWAHVVEDPEGDASQSIPGESDNADLVELSFAESPTHVWVRLETVDSPTDSRTAAQEPLAQSTEEVHTRAVFTVRTPAEDETRYTLNASSDDGFDLEREGEPVDADLEVSGDSRAGNYSVGIPKHDLLGSGVVRGPDLVDPFATALAERQAATTGQDRAPDQGTGASFPLVATDAEEPAFDEATGPDFAGASSSAYGPDGRLYLAYLVYDDDRGTSPGLYHAAFQPGDAIQAERIAGTQVRGDHAEDATRTQIDVDDAGNPAIVYHPDPGATEPDSVAVLEKTQGRWIRHTPLADAAVDWVPDTSRRAVPDLDCRTQCA
jgi:hypothetical protein